MGRALSMANLYSSWHNVINAGMFASSFGIPGRAVRVGLALVFTMGQQQQIVEICQIVIMQSMVTRWKDRMQSFNINNHKWQRHIYTIASNWQRGNAFAKWKNVVGIWTSNGRAMTWIIWWTWHTKTLWTEPFNVCLNSTAYKYRISLVLQMHFYICSVVSVVGTPD